MRTIGPLVRSSIGLLCAIGLLLVSGTSLRRARTEAAWAGAEKDYLVAQKALAHTEQIVLSIAAGDLDGDGDLDLVSDGLLALDNPYPDTFASLWVSATLAPGISAQDLALADLDLDGDLDLVAGGDFGLALWQNPLAQSAGTPFGAWPVRHVLTPSQPVRAVAVADLDGDGWPDIAAARDDPVPPVSGELSVWQNPQSFAGPWASFVLTTALGIHTLSAGDLDGDGRIDLVTGAAGMYAAAQEIRVWQNDGTPFAGPWASYPVADLFRDKSSSNVNSVVLADLDDDGRLDVVAGYQTGTAGSVGVWRNRGTPFSSPWAISATMTGGARVWRVAAGDVDGDGKLDLVSAAAFSSTGNEVSWWWNDGTPFDGAWSTTWRVGPWHSDLLLADLSGNGDLETVVARWEAPEIVAYVALSERVYLPLAFRG